MLLVDVYHHYTASFFPWTEGSNGRENRCNIDYIDKLLPNFERSRYSILLYYSIDLLVDRLNSLPSHFYSYKEEEFFRLSPSSSLEFCFGAVYHNHETSKL